MGFVGTPTSASVGYSDNAPTVAVPAGAADGDLYVMVVRLASASVTIDWPDGFDEVSTHAVETSTVTSMRAAIKVATGSETGSFEAIASGYQSWQAACGVVTGFGGAEVDSSSFADYAYSAEVILTGGEITTSQANSGILWLAATGSTGGAACTPTVTPPAEIGDLLTIDFTNGGSITFGLGVQASAGSASYSGSVDFDEVADGRSGYLITLALPPVDAPPEGAILEANVLGSATVTADLYAPGPVSGLAAQVLGSATVTAALTTAITLQASVLGRASVRAKLDGTGSTSIFLQSTAVQPLATGPWIPSPWFSSST